MMHENGSETSSQVLFDFQRKGLDCSFEVLWFTG